MSDTYKAQGAGLGLRRALVQPLRECGAGQPDFIELSPENWMAMGGRFARDIAWFGERYPLLAHGLSLSLGGADKLDDDFVRRLGRFLKQHRVRGYSEHLSYCSAGGHLYDLLPLPFTEEAVRHVSARIRQVQDRLGQRIAVENISAYARPRGEMSEAEFVGAVLEQADCQLLLDVNNVYVNSVNHGFDASEFIASMPTARIAWLHVAGHWRERDDLLIDTHGDAVCDPVWQLLRETYQCHGVLPTLLERDFNLPPLAQLLDELDVIRALQRGHRNGQVAA